jgi:hypothetical protein
MQIFHGKNQNAFKEKGKYDWLKEKKRLSCF